LKPEEKETLRKREERATVRAALAERKLELVDLRGELAAFYGGSPSWMLTEHSLGIRG